MSIQLPYQQAVCREAVSAAENLPRNICVDSSLAGSAEKTLAAFEIFSDEPERNALIMTDPVWQPRTREIAALERLSGGMRFKLAVPKPTLEKIRNALVRNFQKRAEVIRGRNPHAVIQEPSQEDIDVVANNIHCGVLNSSPTDQSQVVSVTTIFMSDYGALNPAAQFINIHVDFNHGDRSSLRKVETQAGNASLIFGDELFDLVANTDNKAARIALKLKNPEEKVDAWSGPEGSAVLMRVPAATLDLKICRPTSHAPGLVRAEGERTRWINVYDIQIK